MNQVTVIEDLVEIPEVKTKTRLPWDFLTEPGRAFVINGVTKKRNVVPPKDSGIKVVTKLLPDGLQVIRVS